MPVFDSPNEEECYLWAILSDPSGLDQAEFSWYDPEQQDYCFRAWPFQWRWWRNTNSQQIDCCARSIGKSLSIRVRACAFPFLHPGQEMVITGPEGNHLDAVTDNVETQLLSTRLLREMMKSGRLAIKHRPFHVNFSNGSRIMGRIPQRTGRGLKGCLTYGTPILTRQKGFIPVEEVEVGDEVVTHEGAWKPVEHVAHDINDCYEVSGSGSFPMQVSCDHRFYGADNMAGPKEKRNFSDIYFADVEHVIDDKFYWATPTDFPEAEVPDSSSRVSPKFGTIPVGQTDWWWLVGRWIADGYRSMDKKNNKGKRIHWIVHPKDQKNVISRLNNLDIHYRIISRSHSTADNIEVASALYYEWLYENFGELSDGKKLPPFVFGMNEKFREALLDGYLSGDGHWNFRRNRWQVGTASKILAIGLQLLAQSLGYVVSSCSVVQPKVDSINGVKLKSKPKISWRLHILSKGNPYSRDGFLLNKVKNVKSIGKQPIVNIVVSDHHSYLSGSIMSHNTHPLWLEMDEAQDFPDDGWTEIVETVKVGSEGAQWRCHGVSRGVRDKFYKYTQPESGFYVHRYTAMSRPTWTAAERASKIQQYGSRDHPDYRRNILGLHGDATNPLFVLHRLLRCVDTVESSHYNQNEFCYIRVNNEMVLEQGDQILPWLDFPASHEKYKRTWIGMDVGFTNHPSEILVFGETPERANEYNKDGTPKIQNKNNPPALKLLTRVKLERIHHGHQVDCMLWLINFYKPQSFAMDKTGLGLPLFQNLQERAAADARYEIAVDTIKGYNFSSKILVDFDSTIEVDEYRGDMIKEQGIERNVLEYSSDKLRQVVDDHRLILPIVDPGGIDVVREFQGQTWSYDKSGMDMYGRRKSYSQGTFHALDAARMAVLAWAQYSIEKLVQKDAFEPVTDIFMSF